jgi:hypothetical protein
VTTLSCKCGPIFDVQWARSGRAQAKVLRSEGITEIGEYVFGLTADGHEDFVTNYQCSTCQGIVGVRDIREKQQPS